MASFLERLKGRKVPTSAEIAKERLKLVLVSDRSDLAPEKLAAMQAEIIAVITRYVRIDEMEVQIKVEQRDRKNYLVADIPLQRDRAYEMVEQEPVQTAEPAAANGQPELEAKAGAAPADDPDDTPREDA